MEHFAELVRKLAATHAGFRFAILGSKEDQEFGAAIARADTGRCLDLTGKISLTEMVEWIRSSELMISNDTGPMHVAAALNKPLVAIFGPIEPRRTGPYRQLDSVVKTQLPCVPCMKPYCTYSKPLECMRALSPELIFSRAQHQLQRVAARP